MMETSRCVSGVDALPSVLYDNGINICKYHHCALPVQYKGFLALSYIDEIKSYEGAGPGGQLASVDCPGRKDHMTVDYWVWHLSLPFVREDSLRHLSGRI